MGSSHLASNECKVFVHALNECKYGMHGVGEIVGTCLGMVGVVLLTRASKVDQQVHTSLSSLLLAC